MIRKERSLSRSIGSHLHRCGVLLTILAGSLAKPALAARVEWSRGGTDLAIEGAQRCTLDVVFTPDEAANLREWRLVWVADQGDSRLRVVASGGTVELAEACDVRQDSDGDRGARVDTAYFCAITSTAASASVRYVLDAPSAAPTRIAVIPVLATDRLIRAHAPGIAEASINGGSASSYPPILVDVEFANTGDATTYRLFGAYLGEIRDARIRQPLSRTTIPIQIVSRSTDSVELKGPLLELVRSGLVEVRNRRGQWASIPIEWLASGLERTVAPRLAVQVERFSLGAAAEPAAGDSAGAITVVPEMADALARAGVVSLSPLFPEESANAGRSDATNLLGEPIELAPLDDWFIATLGLDAELAEVLERVRSTPGVREAFMDDWRYLANLNPNDPLFSNQWGLQNSGGTVCGYTASTARDIGAVSAWDQTTGNPAVRVAILDTGINWAHEDFGPNRVKLGPDFVNVGGLAVDDNGHGTSVAGIAAALGNNSTGVAGTAWQVQPWAVKVLNWAGGGTATQLSSGILWASSQKMPILNMSLGWAEPPPGGHNVLADATLDAFKRGLLLVASSGNADEDFGPFIACPAHLDRRVYAVGAFLPNGNRWRDLAQLQATDCDDFDPCRESNFGDFLDATAPGGRLITTTDLGSANYLTLANCIHGDRSTMAFGGTSASAPYVSGIAGLLMSRRPELIGEDIAQVLNRTTNGPFLGWTDEYGWGRVKVSSALNFVGPGKIVAHWGAGPGPFSLGPLQVTDSMTLPGRSATSPECRAATTRRAAFATDSRPR